MPPPHHTVLVMLHIPVLEHKALVDRIEAINKATAEASNEVYCTNSLCDWETTGPKPERCPLCGTTDLRRPTTPWPPLTVESFLLQGMREELDLPTAETVDSFLELQQIVDRDKS